MDCCSSSSYMDYNRHHSMNSNFCYPYTPSMLRSASPYPLGGSGVHGSSRYGSSGDYRTAALGYPGATAGYDGYEKYYGGGGGGGAAGYHHPAASAYASGYYGNYPSPAYREYGGYGGHYYHQSQSPYARAAAGATPSAYGGGSYPMSYPGSGRHYPSSLPFGHPFGRESYYHHNRDVGLHHQPQYSSFASYGSSSGLTPYHRNGVGPGAPEHPSKSQQQQQQQQQHQPYPVHQSFPGSHQEGRAMVGESANGDSPSSASLFSAPNSGYSPSPSDYALPRASFSGSGDSPPQHPLGTAAGGPAPDDGSGSSEHRPASGTPAPPSSQQSAMLGATGEFSPGGAKDTRMRKPKERKLQRAYGAGAAPGGGGGGGAGGGGGGGGGGSGRASRNSSPGAPNGPSGNGPASTRIKSLDALTNLCWPDGDQFPTRMRKHSNANGLRSKDASNGRKENNELDSPSSMASSSPRGVVSSARRTKKQTAGGKQSAKEAKAAAEGKEKPTSNETITPTAPVENKNVTPLPGFQQAFGSTEIGKFSEVFFNSSPSPADHSPAEHHPLHHHQEPHQHPDQSQSQRSTQPGPGRHGASLQQQQQQHQLLAMEALSAYESDVDTLSPQPWDPTRAGPRGPGDSYEGAGTGYNLQIGTSFHPAYYESSSYSDHAVDSPLGNYFSEMTCNEFVN